MTSTALLTDRYELTMVDAALLAGTHDTPCVFELFARRLPNGRRYGVVAGTGRLLDAIAEFRFGPAELAALKRDEVVSADTLDWLESYRFTGDIRGYREGELYFPGSPLLVVEAGFAEGVILETLALSTLNYDSAVASAAARAAYIAGFGATSNLEAGRTWGVPTMGTAAHAFTLLFPDEEQAFRAQVASMGVGTTLLVDTYDIRAGVENAVRAAGTELGAVRIDSGDLGVVVAEVREQLDALGATGTRITVTNDLDEYAIAALSSAPVDSYGVGTALVTGSGAPAAGMVYKLVARRDAEGTWIGVGKSSEGKATIGGRKQPVRALRDGVAVSEDIHVDDPPVEALDAGVGRLLHTTLMTDGEATPEALGPDGVERARAHHAAAIAELPADALRLSRGEPAIPTRYL
jgi:nicotinate phosphoribosyltransferase